MPPAAGAHENNSIPFKMVTTDISCFSKQEGKSGMSWAHLSSHFPFVIPSQSSAAKQENKRHLRRTGVKGNWVVGGGEFLLSLNSDQAGSA